MLEEIIEIITILFLLSLICERIAEFLKYYLNHSSFFGIGDTRTKYFTNEHLEDLRHFRILKINIWSGVITAVLIKADLIKMFNNLENPGKTIGWETIGTYTSSEVIVLPIGIALTAFFISFGSKFWHDMLDLLLEVKNTKRILNNTRVESQLNEAIPDFSKLPEAQQVSLLEAAVNTNWDRWMNMIPSVTGVGIADKVLEKQGLTLSQKVIQFQVAEKKDLPDSQEKISPFIVFNGYRLPTDIIEGEVMNPQYAYPGHDVKPRKCGASISREADAMTGTISLKAKRIENGMERFYMLTCGHVVMHEELKRGIREINEQDNLARPMVICPGLDTKIDGELLGKLTEAKLTSHTDSALIRIENANLLDGDIYNIGKIDTDIKVIDSRDIGKTRVKFSGAFSGLVDGILIKGYRIKKEGNYPSRLGSVVLRELITIDRCSEPGDSGAAVLTSDNKIVGIIVGADSKLTYIIPIQSIKSAHKQFQII